METFADHLFSRRLVIQSGKGGTGKTTISSALALLAARRGLRVLLVEVDTRDRFAHLFGREEPVGYDPVEVHPGVFAMNLDPDLVVVDFFKTHIKIKAVYGQIAESKIFKYFFAAAPGLRELICLGKIWRLLGETKRRRPVWDCVILDAPATGHGLAILNIADAAYETLFGPMKTHAGEIRDMLRDPATTVLNLCALPEEMPVNEAADLYQAVRSELRIHTGVSFMNAVIASRFDADGIAPLLEAANNPEAHGALTASLGGADAVRALARSARSRLTHTEVEARHIARMRERVPLPLIEVPYLFEADFDRSTLEAVADSLADTLARPRNALPAGARA